MIFVVYNKELLLLSGAAPHFGPCRLMDFELEMGCFVGGPPTALGQRVTAKEAEDRIFGFVLLNDWSGKIPLGKQNEDIVGSGCFGPGVYFDLCDRLDSGFNYRFESFILDQSYSQVGYTPHLCGI